MKFRHCKGQFFWWKQFEWNGTITGLEEAFIWGNGWRGEGSRHAFKRPSPKQWSPQARKVPPVLKRISLTSSLASSVLYILKPTRCWLQTNNKQIQIKKPYQVQPIWSKITAGAREARLSLGGGSASNFVFLLEGKLNCMRSVTHFYSLIFPILYLQFSVEGKQQQRGEKNAIANIILSGQSLNSLLFQYHKGGKKLSQNQMESSVHLSSVLDLVCLLRSGNVAFWVKIGLLTYLTLLENLSSRRLEK